MKTDKSKFLYEAKDEGGIWELWVFAIVFVLIFCVVARAEAAPTSRQSSSAVAAKGVKKVSKQKVTGSKVAKAKARAAQTANVKISPWKTVATNKKAPADQAPVTATVSGSTQAAPEAVLATTKLEEEKPVKFSGSLLVSTSATLDSDNPTNYSGLFRLGSGVAYAPMGLSASVSADFSREYSYERDDSTDGDIEALVFGIRKTWKQPAPFLDKFVLGVGGGPRVSREHARRTFLGSVGPNISGSKQLGRFELSQLFSYSYGFYEYDIRANGVVNSPHSFRSNSEVSFSVTEKLGLGIGIDLRHAVSFQGVGRTVAATSAAVSYQAFEKVGVALGIGTQKGTQTPDGQSNRVDLYDPANASASLDVSIGF